jgi:pimeloyl-ACP methyl ester carboxylesterase
MKSRSVLAFVIVFGLSLSPLARAADFLESSDVEELGQIKARASEFKPAPAPVESVQLGTPVQADAPVDFKFNPEDVKGKDVVVLSVCGLNFGSIGIGGFQVDMLLWYYHRLFPNKPIPVKLQNDIVQAVHALSAPVDKLQGNSFGSADNYLEDALRGQLSGAGKKYLVVPMPWTRNPQKSDAAVADFKAWTAQVYAAAQKNGKPVYVVAHSWGTLLALETLEGLSKEGSPVHVEKLVTLGSPLVPSQWWVKLFVRLEEHFQGMEQKVSKPANVKTWINFWAKRDQFSNSIPLADGGNCRVDAPADPLAEMIQRALFNPLSAIKKLAAKDWLALNSIDSWHGSYMFGYHQFFPSIKQTADIEVFGPDILPKL